MISEKFINNLKNSAIFGLIECENKETITYINQRTLKVLDFSKDEMLGKKIFSLISNDLEKRKLKEMLEEKGIKKKYLKLHLIAKDGNIIPTKACIMRKIENSANYLFIVFHEFIKEKTLDKFFRILKEINAITNKKTGKMFKEILVNHPKNRNILYLDKRIIPIKRNRKSISFMNPSSDITMSVDKQRKMEFKNRVYTTLYELTMLSMRSKSAEEFLSQLPSLFTKYMKVDLTLSVLKNKEYKYNFFHSSSLPVYNKLIDSLKIYITERLGEKATCLSPFEKSIKYKRIYLINNILDLLRSSKLPSNKLYCCLETYKINSCCFIPIIERSNSIGFLALMSKNRQLFSKDIYNLLNIVPSQIKFILDKFHKEKFSHIIQKAIDYGFEFVVITDSNFNIVYLNNKALQISGYTENEIIGKNHSIFFLYEHNKNPSNLSHETLTSGKVFSGIMSYKTKKGKILNLYTTIIPLKENNIITHYISIGKQIGTEERLKEQIKKLMSHDPITELENLHFFRESIEKFTKGAEIGNLEGFITIINPLSFKRINEAFGFEKGNEILKIIAQRIKGNLRNYDIVAKLESDRFGILIKYTKNQKDMFTIAMKVLKNLTFPYKLDKNKIYLSFNMGISMFPKDGKTADELLHKAQVALTDAKHKGENKIGFFRKELEVNIMHKLRLRERLEQALINKEFIAYYQPYVDEKKEIVGIESLIRWKRNNFIIQPAEFISFLEETDIITDIEHIMIDMVTDKLKHLINKGYNPPPIAINISEKNFKTGEFVRSIISLLDAKELDRNLLRIEIVERTFIKEFGYVKNQMEYLAQQGILFSLDDFGTEYSSLSYLAELPIKYIKIDISFIKRILKSTHIKKIVQSIISVANSLDMLTIAEGVETNEQFELLKKIGCNYFQGYLFYKPMPSEELEKILSNKKI